MCWNWQASTIMAAVGFAGAIYQFKRANTTVNGATQWQAEGFICAQNIRALTLIYFALMEVLQAVSYNYIDSSSTANGLLALIAFVHIALQPIVILWFILSFLPLQKRVLWLKIGTPIAVISTILMLLKLVVHPSLPGCLGRTCTTTQQLTHMYFSAKGGANCSASAFRVYNGNWHLAWQWVMNSCKFLSLGYVFTVFVLPLFARCYRVVIYLFVFGPVLSAMLTSNPDEVAAIWCLFSVAIVLASSIKPLEKFLSVRRA